mmetsp:Transcript_20316/g.27826  ORF Transcript_20316/g.27826 Transcript_20316/m.27826 type:complete len:203 (+) Transcript_20316:186-794(+)
MAFINLGLLCAFCMSAITFGFFIISCALPMASPIPPIPPIPPMPPNGLAPPAAPPPNGLAPAAAPPPPIPPMFFSMSAIFPIPPIPPAPPPNGLAPAAPPNGLPPAPPPNGLPAPPAPPPCCCSDDLFLGPLASSVNTSTFVYSAYPSSSSPPPLPLPPPPFVTLSTRASARAFTNSDFSKKDFVDIPRSSNSFFNSDALRD